MKNKIFKKSLKQYNENLESYQQLLNYIRVRYDMPKSYLENQIKKDIYNIYTAGLEESYFGYKVNVKEYIYVTIFYLYLLLSLPFSFVYYFFIKKKKFDIIYEEIWPGHTSTYKRFYIYIDKFLNKYNSLLLICPLFKPLKKLKITDEYKYKKFINRGLSNYLFYYLDILNVLKNDLFTIYTLLYDSKKANINLIIMYLRIIRRLLFYKAQTYNISSTVLVGANDYYWNPTKYYIFKNNGFKNIILLQHNYKHEIDVNSLYIYCDIYFADSKNALSVSEYIIAQEKHAIGNLQLSPFIEDKKNIEYDIFVVHHPIKSAQYDYESGLNKDKVLYNYEIFLNFLETFAYKNPNITILYVSKTFKDNRINYFNENKQRLEKFENIKCITTYGKETYRYMNNSKVLINHFSSLGVQSYGLDLRVLWMNLDNLLDDLGLPNLEENIDVLIEAKYDVFESKLLNLLHNNSGEMKEFVKNKKELYMYIKENPAKIVADKINKILG